MQPSVLLCMRWDMSLPRNYGLRCHHPELERLVHSADKQLQEKRDSICNRRARLPIARTSGYPAERALIGALWFNYLSPIPLTLHFNLLLYPSCGTPSHHHRGDAHLRCNLPCHISILMH